MSDINYNPATWKLVANNLMVYAMGASFRIESSGDDLKATLVHIEEPEILSSYDMETLKKIAVRAYWRAIGFGKTALELKPN